MRVENDIVTTINLLVGIFTEMANLWKAKVECKCDGQVGRRSRDGTGLASKTFHCFGGVVVAVPSRTVCSEVFVCFRTNARDPSGGWVGELSIFTADTDGVTVKTSRFPPGWNYCLIYCSPHGARRSIYSALFTWHLCVAKCVRDEIMVRAADGVRLPHRHLHIHTVGPLCAHPTWKEFSTQPGYAGNESGKSCVLHDSSNPALDGKWSVWKLAKLTLVYRLIFNWVSSITAPATGKVIPSGLVRRCDHETKTSSRFRSFELWFC